MSRLSYIDKHNPTYTNDEFCCYLDISELHFDGEDIVIDCFFIILCTQGELNIDIKGVPYQVHANNLVLCKPNDVINNLTFSPSCKCEILMISNALAHECMNSVRQLDKFISMIQNPIVVVPEIYFTKFYLYKKLLTLKFEEERTALNYDIVKLILKAALYEIIQLADSTISLNTAYQISRKEILFKDFIGILSNLTTKPRSVSWYADRLCVTPKYLTRVTKTVSGKGAFEWINEYVLKDIFYLLKTSDKSISEISDELQFPNTSFFGKYIKAHTGLTPKQLRLQLRSKVS